MKVKLFIAVLVSSIFVAVATSPTHAASTNNFYFDSFSATYTLSKDGDNVSQLHVFEQLVAQFPNLNQNHGITRLIPYTNQDGANRTLFNTHIDVTRNGQPEPIAKTESTSDYYEVYVGDADTYVHGTQTYTLDYNFERVITDFTDYQELYWDTNGTGWSQSFNNLSATIKFDQAIADAFTGEAKCFIGVAGSKNESDCSYTTTDDSITFTAERPLRARENLTFVLKFQPGTFAIPAPDKTYLPLVLFSLAFLGSLAALALAVFKVRPKYLQKLKKYRPAAVPPQYLPPTDISVAEANKIYTRTVANKTNPAWLIQLAVTGKIKIIETAAKHRWLSKPTYGIEIIDSTKLSDLDQQLLQIFFGTTTIQNGTTVDMPKTATTAMTRAMASLQTKIDAHLITLGYHQKVKSSDQVLSVLLALASVFAMPFISGFSSSVQSGAIAAGQSLFPLFGVVAGIIVILVAAIAIKYNKYAILTEKGFSMHNYLRGLERYIKLAEVDRIKFHQSPDTAAKIDLSDHRKIVKLYEKLLPYAMIFNLEQQWSKQLEVYYQETGISAPLWYAGAAGFNATNFSSFTSNFTSSSSSSGFSGGGSSGGGGGGGGGGGW